MLSTLEGPGFSQKSKVIHQGTNRIHRGDVCLRVTGAAYIRCHAGGLRAVWPMQKRMLIKKTVSLKNHPTRRRTCSQPKDHKPTRYDQVSNEYQHTRYPATYCGFKCVRSLITE